MAETKAAAADGAASRPSTAASASTTATTASSGGGSGNVDKKALKDNFEAFAKFGDKGCAANQ